MPVSAEVSLGIKVAKTFSNADSGKVKDSISLFEILNANTTEAITKAAVGSIAMSAGSATIDLDALADDIEGAASVSGNGLKPRAVVFYNPGANAITIAEGASEGYHLLGASFTFILPAGGYAMFKLPEAGTDEITANTDDKIDISGTGTDTLQYAFIFG